MRNSEYHFIIKASAVDIYDVSREFADIKKAKWLISGGTCREVSSIQTGYCKVGKRRKCSYLSEVSGLTLSDIEFKEMRIRVNHQLQRTSQMQYIIQAPKTERGVRYVPMRAFGYKCHIKHIYPCRI